MATRFPAPKMLASAAFAFLLLAAPASVSFAQDDGDSTGGGPPPAEDTSVYQETPVIQGREASFSLSAFWSGGWAVLSTGTLDYEGNIDIDLDGVDETEMSFKADGEWELAFLRGGIRMEIGRKTMRFRMDLFYQTILARFVSDGKTDVDFYNTSSGSWNVPDSTARNSFHLAGGGIALGFDAFIIVARSAKGLDGVPKVALGPTVGLCIHLSAGQDTVEKFYAGYAAVDLGVGFKARFLNHIEVFAEGGAYAGATVGAGDEVNLAVAPGLCLRCCLGFGFCF